MEIEPLIKEISEAVVMVEPSDLQALALLHTRLEQVRKWAAESSRSAIAEVAESTARLVERIILDETPDSYAAVRAFAQSVSGLQRAICEGRPVESIAFPSDLGLSFQTAPTGTGPSSLRAGIINVDEAMFSEFLSRQTGVLEEMEELILKLEDSPDASKARSLRGLVHTMKGESGVIGLNDVVRVCHAVEDRLERESSVDFTDVLLEVKDWLLRVYEMYAGKGQPPEPAETILRKLTAAEEHRRGGSVTRPEALETLGAHGPLSLPPVSEPTKETPVFSPLEGDVGLLGDFVTEAREHLDNADVHLLTLETSPEDEEALNAVFRAFHTIKGVAGFLALDEIQSLAHQAESLLDRARKGQLTLVGSAINVTFESVDELKRLVNRLGNSLSSGEALQRDPDLPDLLASIQAVLSGKEQAVRPHAARGESAQASAPQSFVQVSPPLPKETAKPEAPTGSSPETGPARHGTSPRAVKIRESIKVDAERLDHLVEMIGELVITESMVTRAVENIPASTSEAARHLKQLGKITRELQAMGTSLRMIPVRSTFQKMARVARDLSKKMNKPLAFITSGEDTELDKTVVDRISDPLVHLVRNAVDHGLEPDPRMRREIGKPEVGRVELRAFHKGGSIYIEIEDDGRGLNREAILNKARERGLVRDGETMSDRDVFSLIFEPGFSTAQIVTDVSGRGVGMDVVRRNILGLRGQIDIQSETGRGSVFTIRLPLTLAIIDGMVVRVGSQRYIIPTLSIVQSVQPQTNELSTILNSGQMTRFQGRQVPLFRLGDLFSVESAVDDPTHGIVVVVEDGEKLAGLVVDDLLGQQQIVIKSLGEFFQGAPGISGGAIMADGRVGLILDVGALVNLVN
ncbi:MAG TPA: Hpt domain-containing protein [bacterium]|nr:Hpt domain-containing protein [bacterium]